ncbi:MAG: hypothetical protein HWN66_08340 [Candidatus Helarchaeota archaeon]|nr:hypothetical protein [Candidatus Helarchaeota archaeon]
MPLNLIKKIKLELKRIRNRQNKHKSDAKNTRKKIKMRTVLWKLLREQSASKSSTKPRRKAKIKEEKETVRKTTGSGHYI